MMKRDIKLQLTNQLDFFNLFDSRLILMLLYDPLNLVINAFSSRLLWAIVQDKWSQALQKFCKVMQKH